MADGLSPTHDRGNREQPLGKADLVLAQPTNVVSIAEPTAVEGRNRGTEIAQVIGRIPEVSCIQRGAAAQRKEGGVEEDVHGLDVLVCSEGGLAG